MRYWYRKTKDKSVTRNFWTPYSRWFHVLGIVIGRNGLGPVSPAMPAAPMHCSGGATGITYGAGWDRVPKIWKRSLFVFRGTQRIDKDVFIVVRGTNFWSKGRDRYHQWSALCMSRDKKSGQKNFGPPQNFFVPPPVANIADFTPFFSSFNEFLVFFASFCKIWLVS